MSNRERELTETVRASYSVTQELGERIESIAALAAVALAATPDRLTIGHTIIALEGIKAMAVELVDGTGVRAEMAGVTSDQETGTETEQH